MHKYLFILLIASSQSFAQSYFPLEVGNHWTYEQKGLRNEIDTFSVSVVGDTLMPNGQNYFILNRAMGPSRFVHADSNFIYYYDDSDSTDTPIYDLNAKLEEWYSIGMHASPMDSPRVQLAQIDTATVFGVTTRILNFDLDWLVPFTLGLSDKFGPIFHYTAHHDPYWTSILSCTISDTTYSTLVSVENSEKLATKYYLLQNYPNPFNPTTTITYTLPEEGWVQLKIFDILGREVITLVDGFINKGRNSVTWNGSDVSSGIYFYRLKFGNQTLNKKMLLVK